MLQHSSSCQIRHIRLRFFFLQIGFVRIRNVSYFGLYSYCSPLLIISYASPIQFLMFRSMWQTCISAKSPKKQFPDYDRVDNKSWVRRFSSLLESNLFSASVHFATLTPNLESLPLLEPKPEVTSQADVQVHELAQLNLPPLPKN